MRSKRFILVGAGAAIATLAVAGAGSAQANTVTYGLQFAPSGYTVYTGWGAGVTAVQATNPPPFFGSDNGVIFSLGTATLTFSNGTNYNIQNGITAGTSTTNLVWLNHAFYLSNSGADIITATLTGLVASDSVNLQFIESAQPFSPTVTVTGGTGGTIAKSIASSPDGTAFVDVGTVTGNTTYGISSSLNSGGGEGDLSGALITITSSNVPEPATLGLMAVGGLAILLVKRGKTA